MRTSWDSDPTVRFAGPPPANHGASAAAHQYGTALLVDLLAGVCGALLTTAFDGSSATRLIGTIVSTLVASLFTVAGPVLHLRATAAVGITVLSLVLTYGGGKAIEPIGGPQTEIFPPITGKHTSSSSPTTPPPSSTTIEPSAGTTCEGSLCIQVTPATLTCTADLCGPVTVTNPGRRVLKIGKVEIIGPAAGDFKIGESCAGVSVQPGRSCTTRLGRTGVTDGGATLVFHQNLDGPPTRVALTSPHTDVPTTGAEPRPDLTLSAAHLRCSVVRHGALSGADGLTVFLSILDIGPVQVPHLVPFSLLSDTGLSGGGNSAISDGTGVTGMQVDLRSSDYGRTHRFDIAVDPGNKIAEQNEQNNRLRVAVTVQGRPADWADQPCRVIG